MLACAGGPDVEQASFFLDGGVGVGVLDRQGSFDQTHQEHRIPFEALGRVQRGKGDALDGRRVLGLGAGVQFGDIACQVRVGRRGGEFFGELHQRDQRLPPLAGGAAGRRLVGQPDLAERGAHGRGQVFVIAAVGDRGAQRHHCLAHLGAREEPLAAAHLVRDLGVGQGLLVDLRLRVDPEQHGHLR